MPPTPDSFAAASSSSSAPPPTPTDHPADRLLARIDARRAPVCVGLDPVLDRLPAELRPAGDDPDSAAEAIERFCLAVIDAVAGHVPAIKPQSACFERHGWRGVRALETAIAHARRRDLEVLLDVKRGDIGTTAAHYAAAATGAGADWATASPYLGVDGLEPLLEAGLGVFALVRTSNPGGDRLQSLPLAGAEPAVLADAVADLVAETGAGRVGAGGYSSLGAVVGATRPRDAARLRTRMPQQIFLVPGYGAQGAGVDDVLPSFDASGRGAVITASRSVLYPVAPDDPAWRTAIGDAAAELAETIGCAVGAR